MLGWFRRHATILMVFLGSGAMVIFGLGPVFDSFARPGSSGGVDTNAEVASWKGGKLTRADISTATQRHYEVIRLQGAIIEAAQKKNPDYNINRRMLIQPVREGRGGEVDRQIIDRLMFAENAKKEGVVASDGMVDDYIAMISGNAGFSRNDLDVINRSENRTSLNTVLEHMKTELLNSQMQNYKQVAFYLPPNPSEAMELYNKTANEIECQVYPVDVKQFLSRVEDPSSAEINKLYEEGKLDFPDQTGEKPGFKIRRKLNVTYLTANFENFLQNKMNELTDEEVQKEYDRLVAEKNFRVMEPVEIDNSFKIGSPPPGLPGGKTDDGKAPADVDAPPMDDDKGDAPKTPAKEDPAKKDPVAEKKDGPATDAPKKDEAKPEDGKKKEAVDTPAEKKEAVEKPADTPAKKTEEADKPAAKKEAVDKPADSGAGEKTEAANEPKKEEPKKEEDGLSKLINGWKPQFVSTSVQDTDPPATPAQEPAKQDPPVTAPATGAGDQTPEVPAPPSDQKPAEQAPSTDAAGGIGGLTLEDQDDKKPEQKAKPLKEVAGLIKRDMARGPAQEAMEKAIMKAEAHVQNYFAVKLEWEATKKGDKPVAPDAEELAKKFGLEARTTGLADILEMREDKLGGVQVGTFYVGDFFFSQYDLKEEYNSERFGGRGLIPDQHLFWFTQKVDARVGKIEECKDQIIEFYKMNKAREMAKAEAEAIAKKVNDARDKKLTDLYKTEAKDTGSFTWFNVRQGGVISQPFNVKNADDEFMQTAFNLAKMEAGVAINSLRDTVYVVQSLTGTLPVKEFGNDYLDNQYMKFKEIPIDVSRAAGYYAQEADIKSDLRVREELGFKKVD